MQFHCSTCDMSVKALQCGKCDAELVSDDITTAEGKKVQVAKCPNGCGKIKSPQCCGHDMEAQNG